MKIAKAHKIESSCSKDETRPGLLAPFVQQGRLIATDGKQLVSIPIEAEEGEDIEGKRIPVEALKAARKATMKIIPDLSVSWPDEGKLCKAEPNGATFPVFHHDTWLPKVGEIISGKIEKEDASFLVTFDIALLQKLSDSLGSDKLTLCFKDSKSMISVYPSEPNGAFGLLMPIR